MQGKQIMTPERKEKEYIDAVVSVRRVTKVTKGGKRFSFSAFVVSGDGNGGIGLGIGKSKEVSSAIAKATMRARKNMIAVALRDNTIPYEVVGHHGASRVILRPAYPGSGVIAGGPVRSIMEALCIKDVLAKSLRSSNQINVVKATLNALAKLRRAQDIARLRGKTVQQVIKGSHA
jgi:small subunit ribosomal protein S5